jgi:ABC-type uncharacterized transport system auxiliary subunit
MAILLLAACGPILELSGGGEAPRLFQLNPAPGLASSTSVGNLTVLVEQPTVPGGLSSDFIAVKSGDHEIKYLAGARWSDRASQLMARYVVESIEQSGAIGVISVESLDLPNDFRLKLDIQEFSAFTGPTENAPVRNVEVKISATIVQSMPIDIVAKRAFSGLVNTRSENPADIVAAMNEAADLVMRDMFAWLLNVVDGAEQARNQ